MQGVPVSKAFPAAADGPTCYLHIGPYKTGSSSLKHFFRDNLEALDRRGLFFPMLRDEQGRPARNHAVLATAPELKPNGDVKASARLWPEIEAVAGAGQKNILLSSEMFSRSLADGDALDRILSFFTRRGYRVVVLAYVRDQPAWLNSWYVQSQKRFAALMSFDEFVDEADRRGRVDPSAYLRPYLGDPRCALDVIPFERAAAAGLEDHFIRRCGAPADAGFVRNPIRNPNAGAKSVYAAQEVMRRLGGGLQDLPGFIGVSSNFRERFEAYGWQATPYVALTEENVARIRARYASSNESFAREFFGLSWAELCPARPFRTSIFDPAEASVWDRWKVERLIRRTVAKFRRLGAGSGAATSNAARRGQRLRRAD